MFSSCLKYTRGDKHRYLSVGLECESVRAAMSARALVSCAHCSAKFLSVADVEVHIANTHGEQGLVGQAETTFGRNTQARMDEDIESIFAKDEGSSDESEDEADGEAHNFFTELKTLREACLPLSQKIRGKLPSERIKLWPQLVEEAKASETFHLGENSARMKSWKSNAKEAKKKVDRFTLWTDRLRKIEGKFGSGVFNYFKLLKWSMMLNLCMALLSFCFIVLPRIILEQKEEQVMKQCTVASTPPNANDMESMGAPDESLWYDQNNTKTCCTEQWVKIQDNNGKFSWGEGQGQGHNASMFFKSVSKVLLDLFQGSGWMEDTMLYYGGYKEVNVGYYQTAYAYFFVMFCCVLFSLFQIVRSSAHSFSSNFKWNQFNSSQYCGLVFCSWDFSITKEDTVNIKQLGLAMEIKTALSTDEVQENYDNKTRGEKALLTLKRILAWLVIIGFYVGVGFLIVNVYNWDPVVKSSEGENVNCDFSSFLADFTADNLICAFSPYLMAFTITSLNLVMPFIFSYIISFEEYDPKTRLVIDIGRSIFLRLMSLLVTIITLMMDYDCHFADFTDSETNVTVQTCSNQGFDNSAENFDISVCERPMCWETSMGEKFYTLTMMDLIIQVLMVLMVDIPRAKLPCIPASLSTIEFNIPKHVLDIIYSQTICWMGLFFSPLISLITLIKLFFIFYIRIGYLHIICKPSAALYEASKMSSIMKNFLLVSLACSLFPLAYIISQMEPSYVCGPFRGSQFYHSTFYGGVVENMISKWDAVPGQNFLYFFGRLEVMIVATAVLLLAAYLQYTLATARSAYNSRIENELKRVADEKRRLTSQYDRARGRTTMNTYM